MPRLASGSGKQNNMAVATQTTLSPEDEVVILREKLRDKERRIRRMLTRLTTLGLTYMPIPEQGPYQKLVKGCFFPFLERDDALSVPSKNPGKGRNHVIIQSDNLAAMMAYNSIFNTVTANGNDGAQNVDVIYIDPPYNTGAKAGDGIFRYNDRIISAEDPVYHSAWLNFMEKRLIELRRSLAPTGVIITSIGPDEADHLGLLLDDVFKRDNRVGRVTWTGRLKSISKRLSQSSDFMYVYTKDKAALDALDVSWVSRKPGVDVFLARAEKLFHESGDAAQASKALKKWFAGLPDTHILKGKNRKSYEPYLNVDDRGRAYRKAPIEAPGGGGKRYEVLHPTTGLPVAIPALGWSINEDKMRDWIAQGKVGFGLDERTIPTQLMYLENVSETVLADAFEHDRQSATKELLGILGRGEGGKGKFNNPKDREVLAKWIDYVTPAFRKEEARNGGRPIRVLDAFAGSGTTMHAVMDLNKADGVPRDCILITNNEDQGIDDQNTETGVARDVTAPRIRAAITGEWDKGGDEGYDDSMTYYRLLFTDGEESEHMAEISRSGDQMLDDMENVLQFEAYFDGLAALETGAHIPVSLDIDGIGSDHYAVMTDTKQSKAVIVWKSSEWAMDEPEVLELAAEAVSRVLPDASERFIYAPGRKLSDFDVPSGWDARMFPLDYIQNLVHTVEKYEDDYALMADFFGLNDDAEGVEEEN